MKLWRRKRRDGLKNYYAILGVSPGASQKAIQKAFWKLAQTCHPDVNPDPDAGEKFKEMVEAYQALKHPDERDDYDARIISEFCKSYLGSFEVEKKSPEKPRPVVQRIIKKGF